MKVDSQLFQTQRMQQEHSSKNMDSTKFVPDEYKDVARGMEQQFLEFMIEQMKKSVNKESEDSSAMDYYESLLTDQQAESMSNQNGGIGIQNLILDQVYPEYMRTEANYNNYLSQKQGQQQYQKASKQGMIQPSPTGGSDE